jgi:NAD(P)-dependent dehydrogenase (short-subunit alcohol dehydrogenase family)
MIRVDFEGAGVIVTGGTRGLGKAIGMEFARAGATVFLTHRWGSVDEDELTGEFRGADLPAPYIVESDASDAEATRDLMGFVKERVEKLDVIVNNVAFAKLIGGLEELKRSSLEISLAYSAWPVVDLIQASREVMGRFPRYVLGISSDGGEHCYPGYDLAGASKSALQTLCRYLALRLRGEGVRVNVIIPGLLDTASFRATFGDALDRSELLREMVLEPRNVARACLGLCSGLMDTVTGQTITVDEGWSLLCPVTYVTRLGWPAAFPQTGGTER